MIETCLAISGRFEGSPTFTPRYTLLTGNFDGQGLSCGCLQWNPGTGSLQQLLKRTFQELGGVPEGYEALGDLAQMNTRDAVRYVVSTWIDTTTIKGVKGPLTQGAKAFWEGFLGLDACRAAQEALAQVKLDAALDEAAHFLPWLTEIDLRTAAFFFDLRVQQGGMTKRRDDGTLWAPEVLDRPEDANTASVMNFLTQQNKPSVIKAWAEACASDSLASVLLHYAYARATMARPEYVWDALSRRGTIACRVGPVHGQWLDLTQILP